MKGGNKSEGQETSMESNKQIFTQWKYKQQHTIKSLAA